MKPLTVEDVVDRSPESEQSQTWIERMFAYKNRNRNQEKNANAKKPKPRDADRESGKRSGS